MSKTWFLIVIQFIIAESLQRTGGSAAQINDAYFQELPLHFLKWVFLI